MANMRRLKRVVKPTQDAEPPPAPTPPSESTIHYTEDEGFIGLLVGLKFDQDNDPNLKCPSCGEEIAVERGMCPICHELIRAKDPYSLEAGVIPLTDAKNVVFVHLDVMAGQLRFVQGPGCDKAAAQEIHLAVGEDSAEQC